MNQIDELIKELSNCGRQVISVKYITDRLRSIERHECEFCKPMPIYGISTLRSGLKSVWKGGD